MAGSGDVLSEAVADDPWHARLVASPVDLEAVRVALVEVVGGDEVEAHAVGVGADAANHDRGQAGLGMGSEDLGRGELEAVLGVCSGSHLMPPGQFGWFWLVGVYIISQGRGRCTGL